MNFLNFTNNTLLFNLIKIHFTYPRVHMLKANGETSKMHKKKADHKDLPFLVF